MALSHRDLGELRRSRAKVVHVAVSKNRIIRNAGRAVHVLIGAAVHRHGSDRLVAVDAPVALGLTGHGVDDENDLGQASRDRVHRKV